MFDFLENYKEKREKKNSVLCIGLDPAPQQVEGKEVLNYCLDMVERTGEYAIAYKTNTQYILFHLGINDLKELNKKISKAGCISILDHKLSDIGSSNEAAIYRIKEAGFEAFTASPFPGNIKETTDHAHRGGLAVIFLTLMSNTQAVWIQKEAMINSRPLYQKIAEEVKNNGADGLVIGTTGHITSQDMLMTRKLAGSNAIFLCPGIGAQGGDMEKAVKNAGQNVLINVGRSILGDVSPKKKAEEYRDLINKYR